MLAEYKIKIPLLQLARTLVNEEEVEKNRASGGPTQLRRLSGHICVVETARKSVNPSDLKRTVDIED